MKPLMITASVTAVVVGLGLGYHLAAPTPTDTPTPSAGTRFPLTPADARDAIEAPSVTVDRRGRVYLAWASRTGDNQRTLFLSRSHDGVQFDGPRAIAATGIHKAVSTMKGKTVTRELRMTPHLAAIPEAVVLAWTETLPDDRGVRMVLAESRDEGETFATPTPVHQSDKARPTFTALSASHGGGLLASWLDNRHRTQQCFASARQPGATSFLPESVVHAGDEGRGVCPCCPTASLLTADGVDIVAFRNVADSFRDIAIGVRKPGDEAFTLHPVVPPTWMFGGCPHDGPSLALVGDTLHVVWMDAHLGSPRCFHAAAKRSDMIFTTEELHPLNAGSQGNAKIVADARGGLHAVWEESELPDAHGSHHEPSPTVGGGRTIMTRSLDGGVWSPARAVAAKSGVYQTRPTLAVMPDGSLVVAFNELDESGKSIVVARLPGAR